MSDVAAKIWRRAPAAAIVLAGLFAGAGLYLANGPSPAWWGAPATAPAHPRSEATAKLAAPPAPSVEPQAFERITPEQAVLLNAAAPISRLPNPPAAPF